MENKKKLKLSEMLLKSNSAILLLILIVVVIVFSVLNGNYFSTQNATNIFYSATTVGLLAIGETFLIIGGHIDLSNSALAAMSGVMVALLIKSGMPWPLAMLLVLLVGAVVGLINSTLANVFSIQPFIATLAVASICEGVGYIISDGRPIGVTNRSFINLGTYKLFGWIPVPVIILIVSFLVFGFILKKTTFGRKVYIIGGNAEAAHLAGISPKRISTVLYVLSSAIGALVGIILAARMHTGAPTAASGADFDAITAAVLGGVAFTGGKGTMVGCFIGLMIIQCFNTGLSVVGVSSFWQSVAKGLLLVFALVLDHFRMKTVSKN
ncbi:ABC transporter permease [Lachnospiraceae bacterium OF09-33XD]|nr:ABC transporter permease [Lachnospiraceae bacterium OF09-33XD]